MALGRLLWRRHAMKGIMVKPLLGAVTVAALIAACSGRGPAADSGRAAQPANAGPSSDCLVPPAACYTPRVFRTAYGISPLLECGIDGRGQTVVMPELAQQPAPDASDIRQDMARFDGLFGLPRAQLRVVDSLAHTASPWLAGGEEVEDAEMVHSVAPGAAISIPWRLESFMPISQLAPALDATYAFWPQGLRQLFHAETLVPLA